MLNIFYKKNGTISIFLVIILVPVLAITCFFVDASRVKLAQSVAYSAGDLALNTTLTNYDNELSEYYGLMASCQDIDEFLDVADEYFTACISSQGVDSYEAKDLADKIADQYLGDEAISDLLQMEITEDSFEVAKMENGSLTNPSILKTEIVDFMKYRSPINSAGKIYDMLVKMKKQAEVAPVESKLADDREQYFTDENDLLKNAFEAYKLIVQYKEKNITSQDINSLTDKIEEYEETYRKCHSKYIHDLYDNEDVKPFTLSTKLKEQQCTTYNGRQVTESVIKQLMINVLSDMDKLLVSLESFESAATYCSEPANAYDARTYHDFYYTFLKNNNIYANVKSNAESMYEDVAKLKNAMSNCNINGSYTFDLLGTTYPKIKDAGYDVIGSKNYTDLYNYLLEDEDNLYATLDKRITDNQSVFFKVTNRMSQLSNVVFSETNKNRLENNSVINSSVVETSISTISKEISSKYKNYRAAIILLKFANNNLVLAKDYAAKLPGDLSTWKDTLNNDKLKDSSGNYDSSVAIIDKTEIDGLNKDDVLNNVTPEAIQELIDRNIGIIELLQNCIDRIDAIKYNGKKIKDISSYEDFVKATTVDNNKIVNNKNSLDSYATESFKFDDGSSVVSNDKFEIKADNSNNPSYFDSKNNPGFYNWMDKKFEEYDPEKEDTNKSDAEDAYDDIKKEKTKNDSDEDKAQLGANGKEINKVINLPSDAADDNDTTKKNSSGVTKFITSLFSDFPGTMSETSTDLVDALYVMDYITSMFSYDTYEKEGKLELARQEGKNVTYSNYSEYLNNEDYKKKWADTSVTKTYNKSLTNNMISKDNCYSYGNEVEYILYGGSNSANKASSYATIYMLRYAFDLPIVFQTFNKDMAVTALSSAISTATYGIIPEPLARTVIILGLNAGEAAMDLMYIKDGMGVKVIKTDKKELFMSFGSAKNDVKSAKFESNGGGKSSVIDEINSFTYSDYLKVFLVLKLINDNKAVNIYKRTADVIQVNMGKITGNGSQEKDAEDNPDSPYLLSKSQVFFELNVDLSVNPLMFALPVLDRDETDLNKMIKWSEFNYNEIRGY